MAVRVESALPGQHLILEKYLVSKAVFSSPGLGVRLRLKSLRNGFANFLEEISKRIGVYAWFA